MNTIRPATSDDVDFIFQLIKDLAEFEKAPEQVTLNLQQLRTDGFDLDNPLYRAFILEHLARPAGFALVYYRYSTWKGKSLYLEDLYILPEFRKKGLGELALTFLADRAVEENCARFEWQVLDWNTPAIRLYEKLGVNLDSEWINCKLEGAEIIRLAQLLK